MFKSECKYRYFFTAIFKSNFANMSLFVYNALILTVTVCSVYAQKPLRTAVIVSPPFVISKENPDAADQSKVTGVCPHNFDGFLVDILARLGERQGLQFCLQQVKDNRYGRQLSHGQWTGMIGEVVKKEADMAAADITIMSSRMAAAGLEFSQPYMSSGLAVVLKKPVFRPWQRIKQLFFMMQPFKASVWLVAAVLAPLVTAVLLYANNRFNPYEWNSHSLPSKDFSLSRVVYYTFASFFWQGFDRLPRSHTGRFLVVTWFLYSAFFLTLYMSSLISFYVAHMHEHYNTEPAVTSLTDLMSQEDIMYGTTERGATRRFFEITKVPLLQEMQNQMEKWAEAEKNDYFVESNAKGLQKVRRDNYAHIMEDHAAVYAVNRPPCDLDIVDTIQLNRHYGFVLGANMSEVLTKINSGLLQMKENNEIYELYHKWWYVRSGNPCRARMPLQQPSEPLNLNADWRDHVTPMELSMFGGSLLLLALGLVASALVMLVERCYFNRYITTPGRRQLILDDFQSSQLRRPGDSHRLDEEPEDGRL